MDRKGMRDIQCTRARTPTVSPVYVTSSSKQYWWEKVYVRRTDELTSVNSVVLVSMKRKGEAERRI